MSAYLILHRGAPAQAAFCHEAWLCGQGVNVLKLYLHACPPGGEAVASLMPEAGASPWYIIPSARRWYRDYVVALLVAEALAQAALVPPQV